MFKQEVTNKLGEQAPGGVKLWQVNGVWFRFLPSMSPLWLFPHLSTPSEVTIIYNFLSRVDSFRFFLEVKQTSPQVELELTILGLGDQCLIHRPLGLHRVFCLGGTLYAFLL